MACSDGLTFRSNRAPTEDGDSHEHAIDKTIVPAPANFDPRKASAEELLSYGIPPRPAISDPAYRDWAYFWGKRPRFVAPSSAKAPARITRMALPRPPSKKVEADYQSESFAGATVALPAGTFAMVTAEYSIPRVSASSSALHQMAIAIDVSGPNADDLMMGTYHSVMNPPGTELVGMFWALGPGEMNWIDNFVHAGDFVALTILRAGGSAVLTWHNKTKNLYSAATVNGNIGFEWAYWDVQRLLENNEPSPIPNFGDPGLGMTAIAVHGDNQMTWPSQGVTYDLVNAANEVLVMATAPLPGGIAFRFVKSF